MTTPHRIIVRLVLHPNCGCCAIPMVGDRRVMFPFASPMTGQVRVLQAMQGNLIDAAYAVPLIELIRSVGDIKPRRGEGATIMVAGCETPLVVIVEREVEVRIIRGKTPEPKAMPWVLLEPCATAAA